MLPVLSKCVGSPQPAFYTSKCQIFPSFSLVGITAFFHCKSGNSKNRLCWPEINGIETEGVLAGIVLFSFTFNEKLHLFIAAEE